MIQVKVPPLGESIVEATDSRWLKKDSEPVAAGDTLAELDTDKITVEVQAPKAGAISKIATPEGTVVKVGDLLADFDESAVGAQTAATGSRLPATGSQPATSSQPPAASVETPKSAAPPPASPSSPPAPAPSGDG